MCNRCSNTVKITCKSRKDLDKILDAIRGDWLWRTFIPRSKEVQEDWDIEIKYSYNWEEERLKKYGIVKPRDWREDWYSECPYKQLWYHWQIDNWWSKWDYTEKADWMPDIWEDDDWSVYCEIFYDSAWSPHIPLRKVVSETIGCVIDLRYDEPWCDFSWEYHWVEWDLVDRKVYDDWYYGNGKKCCICNCKYDNTNPDDWWDKHHTVCIYCWEDLEDKKKQNVS